MVNWSLTSCQPHSGSITSGRIKLRQAFKRSFQNSSKPLLIHMYQSLLKNKSCKTNPYVHKHKTKHTHTHTHQHQTKKFQESVPPIPQLLKVHNTARACWYRQPFRLFYRSMGRNIKRTVKTVILVHNGKYQCHMAAS